MSKTVLAIFSIATLSAMNLTASELVQNEKYTDPKYRNLEHSRQDLRDYNIGKYPLATASLNPGPSFENSNYKFLINGDIKFDGAIYNPTNGDQNNGMGIKNATLAFNGEILQDWIYNIEATFATFDDDFEIPATLSSAYIGYQALKYAKLYAGFIDPPFGMEHMGSGKWTTFMRRGSVNIFSPKTVAGLMAKTNGMNWSLSGAIFGDEKGADSSDFDDRLGMSLRTHVAPIYEAGDVLHFGASIMFADNPTDSGGDPEDVTYKEFMGSTLGKAVVNSNTIANVKNKLNTGVEFAFAYDAVSLQAEYVLGKVRFVETKEANLHTTYVTLAYTLTGESRQYDAKAGTFGRINPKSPFKLGGSGWGAFEVAGRFNHLDLKSASVDGGLMNEYGLALNWYVNSFVKFSANALYANINGPTAIDDKIERGIVLRSQIIF